MITGFQLDPTSKALPLGVRIVVTLTNPYDDPYTFAITPIGILRNFNQEICEVKPTATDQITLEETPTSLGHRFIFHMPEDQRLLIGRFPERVAFDISVERQGATSWLPTNRVLFVVDGPECHGYQAKEFNQAFNQ